MKRSLLYFVVTLLLAPTAVKPGAARSAAPVPVRIDNFSFQPSTVTVPAGATVCWVNRDEVPHNVVDVDKKYKSGVLDTGDQFSHTFDTPGTYNYYCSIHPRMTGRVIVK